MGCPKGLQVLSMCRLSFQSIRQIGGFFNNFFWQRNLFWRAGRVSVYFISNLTEPCSLSWTAHRFLSTFTIQKLNCFDVSRTGEVGSEWVKFIPAFSAGFSVLSKLNSTEPPSRFRAKGLGAGEGKAVSHMSSRHAWVTAAHICSTELLLKLLLEKEFNCFKERSLKNLNFGTCWQPSG